MIPRKVKLHKTSQIGYRESNEDRESYLINLKTRDPEYAPVDFFAVYDGHGGDEVSDFIHIRVRNEFTAPHLVYPLPVTHVHQIFDRIQDQIKNHPKKIGIECGSTCLIVVRYYNYNTQSEWIQVINLGDCRAVLCRGGFAIPLSIDHKPGLLNERRRIEGISKRLGTNVRVHFESGDYRVIDLSVSRAFGDIAATPYVSHRPDSNIYELNNKDEFIVLGCDGVWDVLASDTVTNLVRDYVANNFVDRYTIPGKYPVDIPGSAYDKNLARKIAHYAIARGSTDNVSVLLVMFNH